ncbi:hypothetical protein O3M35_013154 [Rhynocoris fuscipes]|uniref:Cytochrome P450 n=1 Tax=Rhynocoris fuscipes TaxID=488301 RepID=A0AAW1CEP4_9HEMI
MDPIFLALIAIILSLIAYAVYQANEANKYWLKRGIPHRKPMLFFGNSGKHVLMRQHFTENLLEVLKDFPHEPAVGFYDLTRPILIIKDIELVEKILVKDFPQFMDRGFPLDKRNAIDISLFTMSGKEWRALRYKLSPLFSTTKLKTMYGSMAECSQSLTSILDQIQEKEDIDLKEYLGRFAMDVIGSCAYGIDAKNLSEPDNEFRKMGKKSFEPDRLQMLKFAIIMCAPKLAKLLRISLAKTDVTDYFCKIIRDTIDYRKKNDIVRNDFLQMFINLKDEGNLELRIKDPDDEYLQTEVSYSVENIEFTDDMMIGNAFQFLQAGFEATAAISLLTLYELSKNMEIQKKARLEIVINVEEAGGMLTYDALKKMTYLEQCIKETFRLYPPVAGLNRLCNKDYLLPNGYKIQAGELVMIPVATVHNDPKIYPEPEKFRPERFDPDQKIPSCAFLPFGNGPRICIAMRFAFLEIKHCIAKLLMNHEYKLSPNSKPFRLDKKSFFMIPADPLLFNIRQI